MYFMNLMVFLFLLAFFYFFRYLQNHEAQYFNETTLKYSKCSKFKKDNIILAIKAQMVQIDDVIPSYFLWTNSLQPHLRILVLGI